MVRNSFNIFGKRKNKAKWKNQMNIKYIYWKNLKFYFNFKIRNKWEHVFINT